MSFDAPTLVVLLSFVLFVALIWKIGGFSMLGKALDARAERIRAELDEARRLREEAQGELAKFDRMRTEAVKEAENIVAQAKRDAAAMREAAEKQIAALIDRRSRQATDKIAQAEADALRDVREKAATAAAAAARRIIADQLDDAAAAKLIDSSIGQIAARLN